MLLNRAQPCPPGSCHVDIDQHPSHPLPSFSSHGAQPWGAQPVPIRSCSRPPASPHPYWALPSSSPSVWSWEAQHWAQCSRCDSFLATRTLCCFMVSLWPTVGQPLANQDTIGLLGHQDTLLPHGQPLVNCWPTVGQPEHHWPSWSPGHTAASWSTIGQTGHHWPSWPPGHPAASWSPCWPPGPSPQSCFP